MQMFFIALFYMKFKHTHPHNLLQKDCPEPFFKFDYHKRHA